MANYQSIVRLRSEVRQFIRNRRWVHRGDVITYGGGVHCDEFSTDAMGFRHSTFRGDTFSVMDCVQRKRYGVVLGPSSVYGFGLAGNENTIPSLLAARFGFPFANVGLPEGNSRNLYSLLLACMSWSPHPPSIVLHVSGGDFTSFCYTSMADPVFGSPNLKQIPMAIEESVGAGSQDPQIGALLAFSSLWIQAIVILCSARRIPIVLADDTTFFEKREPSDLDRVCELGAPFSPSEERQFKMHRTFVADYHTRRKSLAEALDVPLAGPGITNDLTFIDEYHYDRGGVAALCDDFANAMDPVL